MTARMYATEVFARYAASSQGESLDAADIGTLADKDQLLSWTDALFEVGDVLVHFAEERLVARSPLLP